MASAPSTPKAGWEVKALGEVCQKIQTTDPRKTPNVEFRYIDVSSVCNQSLEIVDSQQLTGEEAPSRARRLVQTNDVLFATVRPTLRRIAMVPESLNGQVCSTGYFVLRPQPELAPRFIYYFLQTNDFMDRMEAIQKGASYPAVNDSEVRSQKLPVPPLAEQERIVGILDEAFEGIAAATAQAEKNLHNARELFQSVLQSTFSQKGDDWEEMTLGELGKVSMCKRILKKQTSPTGDIPFYKIGTFGKAPNAFIENDIYQEFREKYSFPRKGDILISASGTIGRRVVYDGEPAYFQDSNIVWIANPEDSVINPYLYYFYGICEWNPSKGATISRLYNDDLRKIKVPFPTDRSRQEELVGIFEDLEVYCQNLEAIYERKQSALAELKQSLLQKAFAGEL